MKIISVGKISEKILNSIKTLVEEKFGISASISCCSSSVISTAFNESRSQYLGSKVIEILEGKFGGKILGVLNCDVYESGLNFIFGESQILGNVAIVSLFRLNPRFYGEENEELYLERIRKEVTHELGHLFGLKHCSSKCVMQFSNSIFKVDEKSENFCRSCGKKLRRNLKFYKPK